MRNILMAVLVLLLIPIFLLAFISIHELGHTILARLLGDPDAVFYFVKVDEQYSAIGLTSYDVSRLPWGANLVVSVGGILATQVFALAALLARRIRPAARLWGGLFALLAFAFAFDLPFQLFQALGYQGSIKEWPTGVDLMDVMLLLQMKYALSEAVLKGLLSLGTVLYLAGFFWLYQRGNDGTRETLPASSGPA